jgi:hypothetical protein
MWKAIAPAEKIIVGDTVRYQPSPSNLSYKLQIYEVVKADQHYFEIIVKAVNDDNTKSTERRIIKHIDIGYHLGLEVWREPAQTINAELKDEPVNKTA